MIGKSGEDSIKIANRFREAAREIENGQKYPPKSQAEAFRKGRAAGLREAALMIERETPIRLSGS